MRSTMAAAGGVLWRERDTAVEVALVHRPKHQDWSLPKGMVLPGEHPLAAAYRHVVSETGIRPAVGARLPSTNYPVLTTEGAAHKTVDYWAMRVDPDVASEQPPGDEIDALRWAPLDEAGTVLSYRRDAEVVAAFTALPRPLSTLVLLRHAAAVAAWDGPEVTRPLAPAGVATAARVADLLTLFAPARLVSATPRRCVQTVEPLATRSVLDVRSDGTFDAEAHDRAPEVTADRLAGLATSGVGPVVVCSQGGVIPDTVALLADTDGLSLPSVRTDEGTAWVLTFGGGTLVAADFLSADVG